MEIKEGSKLMFKLHGVGSQDIISTCEVDADVEIKADAITVIENGLFCTDTVKPVEQIDDNTYIVNVWLQDAYCIKNNVFLESISEVD